MSTGIEWTDATWNPTTGCDRVSPGCAHCYALTLAKRLKAMGQPRYQKDGGRASGPGFGLTMHEDSLNLPLSWKKPRRVFVNSMSDLFHEEVTFDFIDRVFAVMALTPQHTYQVLTKRPERMREYMTNERRGELICYAMDAMLDYPGPLHGPSDWPLPNVWLGVTVENQHFADERIPILLDTPAAVRFISAEPLLEPVSIGPFLPILGCGTNAHGVHYHDERCGNRLDWVIIGGESGPRHRPFSPDWARLLVAQCRYTRLAVFVKQMGGLRPGTRLEDLPEDLRVRQFPEVLP